MIEMIDERVNQIFSKIENSKLREAMLYSLQPSGKLLRPRLLLSLLSDLVGDYSYGLDAAVALEMIHTYSLVHDDLPAMDDDDFRRHKASNHRVYGEGRAILAGDALLNTAFELISTARLEDKHKIACIEILSRNSGVNGMILGQDYDLENDIENLEELLETYRLKTGKLFSASFEMAVVLADHPEKQNDAQKLGEELGVYFQVQDDLLEATEDFETLGKLSGSDNAAKKITILSFLTVNEAKKKINEMEKSLQELINKFDLQGDSFNLLINEITHRNF